MSSPPSLQDRTSSSSSIGIKGNLPPPRTSNAMKPVSAPLSSTRLHRLIYLLTLLTTLLVAFYSYRIMQLKSEVGGWWNLAVGNQRTQLNAQDSELMNTRRWSKGSRSKNEESVENKINELAHALGVPSTDLASAIAIAVKKHVSPASLSHVGVKETGPAVEAMIKNARNDAALDQEQKERSSTGAASVHRTGVMGGIVTGMDNFVGMDEP